MSQKRTTRKLQAEHTLRILQQGHYTAPLGHTVSIQDDTQRATQHTSLITPDDNPLSSLRNQPTHQHTTRFTLTNETTLSATERLATHPSHTPPTVLALNFASAKNPGGGFLGGSQAQEESLARSSALYPCLRTQPTYYATHRHTRTCLYTHHMIYSPDVPVFRRDDGTLLNAPYLTSFITSPAVNAGALKSKERPLIEPTMLERTARLLALCALHKHHTLVLGAWGCGVFRNDPNTIARIFAQHLIHPDGAFTHTFQHVHFAVLDNSKRAHIFQAFHNTFQNHLSPP